MTELRPPHLKWPTRAITFMSGLPPTQTLWGIRLRQHGLRRRRSCYLVFPQPLHQRARQTGMAPMAITFRAGNRMTLATRRAPRLARTVEEEALAYRGRRVCTGRLLEGGRRLFLDETTSQCSMDGASNGVEGAPCWLGDRCRDRTPYRLTSSLAPFNDESSSQSLGVPPGS